MKKESKTKIAIGAFFLIVLAFFSLKDGDVQEKEPAVAHVKEASPEMSRDELVDRLVKEGMMETDDLKDVVVEFLEADLNPGPNVGTFVESENFGENRRLAEASSVDDLEGAFHEEVVEEEELTDEDLEFLAVLKESEGL